MISGTGSARLKRRRTRPLSPRFLEVAYPNGSGPKAERVSWLLANKTVDGVGEVSWLPANKLHAQGGEAQLLCWPAANKVPSWAEAVSWLVAKKGSRGVLSLLAISQESGSDGRWRFAKKFRSHSPYDRQTFDPGYRHRVAGGRRGEPQRSRCARPDCSLPQSEFSRRERGYRPGRSGAREPPVLRDPRPQVWRFVAGRVGLSPDGSGCDQSLAGDGGSGDGGDPGQPTGWSVMARPCGY